MRVPRVLALVPAVGAQIVAVLADVGPVERAVADVVAYGTLLRIEGAFIAMHVLVVRGQFVPLVPRRRGVALREVSADRLVVGGGVVAVAAKRTRVDCHAGAVTMEVAAVAMQVTPIVR